MLARTLVLLAALAAAVPAAPAPEVFRTRRAALRQALPGGVVVLFGRAEPAGDETHSGFFQEANFYYLTGWQEPGAILLVAPGIDELFLPRRSAARERFTGPRLAADDPHAAARTGFSAVLSVESFEEELRKALGAAPKLYTISAPATARLRALAPLREVSSAATAVARLRMRKSPEERALIGRATTVTIEAHRAAWRRVAAGAYEYQVAATLVAHFLEQGCQRWAYSPIVGSGPNALTLHYWRNARRMNAGELVLIDAAAECGGYASDITRTIPVSGTFTKRQREIYDVVLGAQKAVIAAAKPGATFGRTTAQGLYRLALEYFNSHGRDLHGAPLGQYFTHGIGHHVGLDAQDAADPEVALEDGMIITVEPGLYIPEEGIGVRIEDIVQVTPEGGKLLSGALPREAAEIEKALQR